MMPKEGPVGQAFFRSSRIAAAAALLSMIAAQPAYADITAEQALAKARRLTAPPACGTADDGDDIVVCGRTSTDRYRIPVIDDGGQAGDTRGRTGEVPSASPERLAGGPCGIFAGERRCGKAEAKLYGYDGGRNPLSLLADVGKALLDPE